MYDKRAERDAEIFGITPKMQSLESDLMRIRGIEHIEFDIRDWGDGIHHVILIPKYDIDVSLPTYYEARRKQLDEIISVCEKHDLFPSGDRIEDMGAHWYIVRTCGNSWLSMQDKILIVKQAAERHHISGGELQRGYWYGQNAYADMLIENALFCDMYPDDVPNREDFHGFCRSNYVLSRAE